MIVPKCASCFGSGVDLFLGPEGEENKCPDCAPVEMKTICTRCKEPLTLHWPSIVEFGGEKMRAQDALAASLRNDSVWICCDKCLTEMPDVKLEDLRLA